jgi:mRNA-degrading endonuclease toxin of MazEF toxin-antitoxin module
VLSVDSFNQSPAGLVVIVPVTTKAKGISLHVQITPPEGAKCEDVRSVSKQRLSARLGKIKPKVFRSPDLHLIPPSRKRLLSEPLQYLLFLRL